MKTLKRYLVLVPLLAALGCSKEEIVENPSGETIIYNLQIVNGDLTGAGKYDGTYDEPSRTFTFTIPAESDIQALKFSGKLSLGASLAPDTYDFSQNSSQDITIVNVDSSATYTATVQLNAPVATPLLDKFKVTTAQGAEVTATVNHAMNTVFLGLPDETEVTVAEVTYSPKRTVGTFTAASAGNKLSAANPGKIQLDFLGLTNEYAISFDNVPTFGAEWGTPNVFDFSDNPAGNAKPGDFSGQLTRSADFDGDNALVVSRQGGNFVKLFSRADLQANSVANPKTLDMTGVSGGTYVISAGRIVHGHVYVCNLTTGITGTAAGLLKIYHWADSDGQPEKVVDFDGTVGGTKIVSGRFGDNMSVNLDENGNGYIYLIEHATGAPTLRFTVTAWNQVTDPVSVATPFSASYYACFNAVDGSPDEYLYTGSASPLALVDKDGRELYKMGDDAIPVRVTDAHIFHYNNERYLLVATARKAASDPDTEILIYNISDGANTIMALRNFESAEDKTPIFRHSLAGKNLAAYPADCAWAVRDDMLYIFGAYCDAGFALAEFEKKH